MIDLVGRIYQNARVLRELETKRTGDYRHYHASEAGDCRRTIALKKLNTVPETTDDSISLLRLGDGHMHGNAVRDLVARIPGIQVTDVERDELIFAELDGYPPIIITGHCDFIVHDAETKTRGIVDVKGINRFSKIWKAKSEDIEALREGYPKAIPQVRLYNYMHDTDWGMVLAKNKDVSEYRQYTIPRDKKKEFTIVKRFAEIAKDVSEGTVPPCDFLKGDSRCKYCPFPSMCGR